MTRVLSVLIVSAAMVAGTPVRAQGTNPDRVTVAWSDPSRAGLLKVHMVMGAITVKTHTGRDVIIDARPRDGRGFGRGAAPAEAAGLRRIDMNNVIGLSIEEEKNVMTVEGAVFRQVDIEIQVPLKTNLNLQTMSGGQITIDGVEGEIEVTNMNGPVTLTNVAGSVVAHSMNSRVVANLREVSANKPMAFTSMNGNVDVTLPSTLKANLKMRTDHGEIYSDFDIKPRQSAASAAEDARGRGGRFRIQMNQNLEGTLNSGGPEIELRALNGNIFIRKSAK